MPRTPILSREGFFKKLGDGTLSFLQWNLVNTSLGAMIEPRQLGFATGVPVPVDAKDGGFTRLVEGNEDYLQALYLTGGQQVPFDYTA